jgi:triacylglycerol lipase
VAAVTLLTGSVLTPAGLVAPALAAENAAIAAAKYYELPNAAPSEPRGTINDWTCKSSKPPVVLIHGTFGFKKAPQSDPHWGPMGRALKNQGRCVFAPWYGKVKTLLKGDVLGVGDIRNSSTELATFVTGIKAATGAAKVDLVGWSQGGLVARQYLKEGGASSVDHLVGLAPPNHGTTLWKARIFRLPLLNRKYVAVNQMAPNSSFIQQLNTPRHLVDGVAYTMLATPGDEYVQPDDSPFLTGPERHLTNVRLPASKRPDKGVDHGKLHTDPTTIAWVKEGIRRPGLPADPNRSP